MFNSTKVLRSHIEMIPIPLSFYQNTVKLELLYDRAIDGEDILPELDKVCNGMFGIK